MTHQSCTFTLTLAMLFAVVGQAKSECFDYRPDSLSETQIVYGVKQQSKKSVNGNLTRLEVRQSVWVGDGDYILVVVASNEFKPRLLITNQGEKKVFAQSWRMKEQKGANYAEVHFSGNQAHAKNMGKDGWIDVVIGSEVAAAGGRFNGWIVPIKKLRNLPDDHCDKKFIAFQGAHDCLSCDEAVVGCPPGSYDDGLGAFGQLSCVCQSGLSPVRDNGTLLRCE